MATGRELKELPQDVLERTVKHYNESFDMSENHEAHFMAMYRKLQRECPEFEKWCDNILMKYINYEHVAENIVNKNCLDLVINPFMLKALFNNSCLVLDIFFNPSNAEATFVQNTRTQRFLKSI